MPNFDGGHYFLTALIPISTTMLERKDGQRFSPVQVLRKTLVTLPTALQSPASEHIGINSPFSKNDRTHFARFVVIEDVMYNGRDPDDAIKASFDGTNPVTAQPQDALSCPFLLFTADFDAASGDSSELTSYLGLLWETMKPGLSEVFAHCVGFESVSTSADFANYIQRGQIETTMSFNDYWTTAPPLKTRIATPAAITAALVIASILAGGLIAYEGGSCAWSIFGAVVALTGIALAVIIGNHIVIRLGSQPFESAPNADMPSILKALYLQQKFTKFAIEMQEADAAHLQSAFADFLKDHQPDKTTPTQPPGIVHS